MEYEVRRKISLAMKGRKKSLQHRRRISQSLKGLKKDIKHRRAIAEALRRYHNNNKVKPIRDEE